MDFLGELFIGTAADKAVVKAVEKSNNEIHFDNFIPQAKKTTILTLIPNCQLQKPGWFGNSSYTIDDKLLNDAYLDLYDYLVKKGVITKKVAAASIWTWDSVYTIDTNLIESDKLKKIISKDSSEFPDLLKCYTIDYEQLSTLLHNYKYAAIDEVNLITNKGGKRKRNKTKKRKTKKI
jgi:hypothetical protein